jgi:hypothetical protein
MSAGSLAMTNCFLTMGVPILWGLYELWALRRARSGGRDRRVEPPPAPKPLPDCLIPKPIVRQRVLEDA